MTMKKPYRALVLSDASIVHVPGKGHVAIFDNDVAAWIEFGDFEYLNAQRLFGLQINKRLRGAEQSSTLGNGCIRCGGAKQVYINTVSVSSWSTDEDTELIPCPECNPGGEVVP